MSSSDKKSIVILSFDTLGDLILRQPLFSALLDEGYPITVVVRDGYRGILPLLDRRLKAITTKINPYSPCTPEVLEQAKELYQKIADVRPDTLVSAPYRRTYLDDWLAAQFRKSNRVGFLNPALSESPRDPFFATPDRGSIPSSELFTRLVQVAEDSHEGIKNQSLLEALLGRPSQKYHPTIKVTADLERQAEDVVSRLKLQPGRYVLGCPAGTVNIPIKFWPEKDYVDLLAHIHDKHQLPVLLTGLPEESSFLERIASEANKRGVACQRWIGSREDPSSLLGLIRHSCLYLGTDSGPMHLAAALDVPVVALFGGGHWPRFLPLAKRSFVATQEVSCFGCNWDCWLDEPICIRKVSVQKFCQGLDWILGSAKDENRVDQGEKPESFSEEIIQRAIPQSRATVQRLRTHSHASDVDRAAKLRVIEEITAQLETSEADRAARLEEILGLQRQIEELATTKASLKRVAAAVARRLGIFHFLKRRQQSLERAYDVLYRMVSRAQDEPPER